MKTNVITRLYVIALLCLFTFSFGKNINPTDRITIYEKPVTGNTTTINKTLKAKNGTLYEMAVISNLKGEIVRIDLAFTRDKAALISCIDSCPRPQGNLDAPCATSCIGNYMGKNLNDPNIITKLPIPLYLQLLAFKSKLENCLKSNTTAQCIDNNIDEIDHLVDQILLYI